MIRYWILVLARAVSDSLGVIGHTRNTIIFGSIVLFLTALWSWRKERDEKTGWKMFFREHLPREISRIVPVAFLAWIPFFLWFMIDTPYKMQDEADHRTGVATQTNTQIQTLYASCQSGLAGSTSRAEVLSQQVASQQQTINSLQATLGQQQGTLNSQQSTTNSCVVALGKASIPEPLTTTVQFLPSDNFTEAKHRTYLLAFTNKPRPSPVKGMVGCEKNVTRISLWVLGTGTLAGGASPVSNGVSDWELDSPGWTPTSPIVFTVFHDEDDIGKCGIQVR
jgi:hypothetical protein